MNFPDKKAWRQGYLKLMNHSASPPMVSLGIAIGLFCAFVIPFGQMALALLLATLLRAAKVPSLLFTWVSNPFTIAIIYPFQCFIGSLLLQKNLSYNVIVELLKDVIRHPSVQSFKGLGTDLIFPFFVGGLALAFLVGGVGYFISLFLIRRFRERKRVKRKKRQERAFEAREKVRQKEKEKRL